MGQAHSMQCDKAEVDAVNLAVTAVCAKLELQTNQVS
jgi:hypothetical protein